jgi:hypothetical protein
MSDKEYGVLVEETGSLLDDTITIDLSDIGAVGSTMSSSVYQYPTYSIGTTAGFNGTSGQYLTSGGTGNTVWTTSPWTIGSTSPSPGLKVSGDSEFEGDVKINGVSIAKALDDIQKRLAILVPDPAKLEHFAALKKAYEHYKTLEALCELPKEESKD